MTRELNGLDVEELRRDQDGYRENPEKCNIVRKMTAEWVGGTRARIASRSKELYIGGSEDFRPMNVTLASFLACELDVIVTNATLRGIKLESLSVEGTGHFNNARYKGIDNESGPGYDQVDYTVRIKASNATPEQLRELVDLCETASPVGDTLMRPVKVRLQTVVE